MYRDNDMLNEAITLLNQYLEVNSMDSDAWTELSDIYLTKQNYQKAQFCYDEILSNNPHNYMMNLKYAEILYSLGNSGDLDNLYLARKYFSHCLVLQDNTSDCNSMRALWGLLQTCKSISTHIKKEDEKNSEIIKTC